MENALTCTLCLNPFNTLNRTPRILRCGHTFCSQCLTSLINSSSLSSPYISCPYDKSLGHPSHDITEIPINRILIDLIDYSGLNLSTLSLSTSSSSLQAQSYLSSAYEKLQFLKDKLTGQYDKLYSLMSLLFNDKVQLVKALNAQYDSVINRLNSERTKAIAQFEQFINAKVDAYAALSKVIDRNRTLALNGLSKVKALISQTVKAVSLTEEIDFVSQLNIDIIDSKEVNEAYDAIQHGVDNDLLFPKLYIKNEIYENIEMLTNSIRVIYPFNGNDKGIAGDISSLPIHQLQISNNFYWFQPNSSNIFQFQIDNNKWVQIENKSGMAYSEMFRVCQLNSKEAFITGGVINFLSSKAAIMFNDGNSDVKEEMFTARRAHGTCLLNEEVYVCGGIDSQGESISQCEKYSLNENKWKKVGDMLSKRSHMSLCAFNHQLIYSFGGDVNEILVDCIECYNPRLDEWSRVPVSLPCCVECCGVIQVSNEDIVIMGGYSNDPRALRQVMLFNEPSFKLTVSSKELSENGWMVYNPMKIGGVVNLLCGGEGTHLPNLIQYILF